MSEQTENKEKTQIEQHREDILAFINTMPPRTVAKALVAVTIQTARMQIEDPEMLEQVVNILKSKGFVNTLAEIVRDSKVEGALKEMSELDVTDIVNPVSEYGGEPLAGQGIAFADGAGIQQRDDYMDDYDADGQLVIKDPDPF